MGLRRDKSDLKRHEPGKNHRYRTADPAPDYDARPAHDWPVRDVCREKQGCDTDMAVVEPHVAAGLGLQRQVIPTR